MLHENAGCYYWAYGSGQDESGNICTAAPTAAERAAVPHHLVAFKALDESYSAADYESDMLSLLPNLWQRSDYAVMCGGSMLYVHAVCHGIDELPTIAPELRQHMLERLEHEGLESLLADLERLDPDYYRVVDRSNPRRVVHAIEICLQAGVPYSTLRTGAAKPRPWRTVSIGLNMERDLLFDRINRRVDAMIDAGLEAEARSVQHLRHLNSLNTVGMKEMMAYFDGVMDRDTAIARIKKNTRVYAKKQLTWLRRDSDIVWCSPSDTLATAERLI